MANLKEIKNRITSVSSTIQITSAMKMVSAAKLKRAQDAILQMRPYAEKMTSILSNLSTGSEGDASSPYLQQREGNKVLLVPITSNRGLCGAFNANVNKRVNALIREDYKDADVHVRTIGKKANDFFAKTSRISDHAGFKTDTIGVFDNLNYDAVSEIALEIMNAFEEGAYDKVVLVYNQFKNAAVQILQTEQFLPVMPPEDTDGGSSDYIFEPNQEEIMNGVIPKSLKVQLYKAVLDSVASEHGARMTAMHKATDNANELRSDLRLEYNKARQAAITGEILEIVAGAEALG